MTTMEKIHGVLLDIEGTTSSITFVHDVLFPFALDRLESYLEQNFASEPVRAACEQIAADAGHQSLADWSNQSGQAERELIQTEVRRLMAGDVKATGLKALQGLIWQVGFESGELRAHAYPDVIPAIRRWKAAGIDVRIYSSGSVAAQKLFFGHLENEGNCLELFSGHYDTRIGGKKEPSSYLNIASVWPLPPASILFISDVEGELLAARDAGLQVLASVRPGNAPINPTRELPCIQSFEQIELSVSGD